MLLYRSIFLQVCLFLTLTRTYCQDYERGYSIDESDHHSNVDEDSGHPDYSKYYTVDTSAPLISAQGNEDSSGHLAPIDFSEFMTPSLEFGASNKQEVVEVRNPFAQESRQSLGFISDQQHFPEFGNYHVDYFDQAQKQQGQDHNEGIEDSFNPDYISAHLSSSGIEGDFSSQVKKVEPKSEKPKKTGKKYYSARRDADKGASTGSDRYKSPDYYSARRDADKDASSESERYKTPDYSYEYKPTYSKYADYNTGKSSSTVAQHPQAAGYYEKLTQAPTATPYQKYSFQPVTEGFKSKYLGSLISTVAPFNPSYNKVGSTAVPAYETQPSENVPAHLKGKNCQRITKHIPDNSENGKGKRDAMNCFVCEDPANNGKITQCSYAVEPEPINDYSGISERYSIPPQPPAGFRFKRYSGGDYTDPYEYIKSRSQKYFEEPKKEYDDYKDFYTGGLEEKSMSEIQAEAASQNPANCHKEESNGMTCTICKDPKSGGNFEQCSYTSAPKEQKYAYVTEKKYDGNEEPAQGSESKPAAQTQTTESTKQLQDVSNKAPLVEAVPTNKPSFTEKNGDSSKLEKIRDYQPSQEFQDNYNRHSNPQIPYENTYYNHKPSNPSNTDNDKYSKLEKFYPSEDYRESYKGHDKFKLSDEYADNKHGVSNDDRDSKKEPLEGYKSGQPSGEKAPKKLVDDEPYQVPKHFAETTIHEQKSGVIGLEPSLYGSSDSSEVEDSDGDADSSSNSDPYKDIDEYHFRLFPDFSKQESQQAEVVANNNPVEPTRKEVEEVLAEFSRKDRSACKKAEKQGMTCYLCVDKKGIQHEECMYIQESKPQASHVAYHEVQQLQSPENQNQQQQQQQEQAPAASEVTEVSSATPFNLEMAASHDVETKIKYRPPKSRRRVAKKVKKVDREREPEHSESNRDDERLSEEGEPKAKETPAEFIVGDEEGAFSAETRPVYSKSLGVKLPRYMIEKSEFEKEFDEFAGW